MRAGASATITGIGNMLLKLDSLAPAHTAARQMAIARAEAVAVVNLNHQPIRAFITGAGNSACQRGVNRRAGRCAEIDTRMKGGAFFERVEAWAKTTGHTIIVNWQRQRNFGDCRAEIIEPFQIAGNAIELAMQIGINAGLFFAQRNIRPAHSAFIFRQNLRHKGFRLQRSRAVNHALKFRNAQVDFFFQRIKQIFLAQLQ